MSFNKYKFKMVPKNKSATLGCSHKLEEREGRVRERISGHTSMRARSHSSDQHLEIDIIWYQIECSGNANILFKEFFSSFRPYFGSNWCIDSLGTQISRKNAAYVKKSEYSLKPTPLTWNVVFGFFNVGISTNFLSY